MDPSAANAKRSKDAVQHFKNAERLAKLPAPDFFSGVLNRHEARQERERVAELLEPDRVVAAAGEAVPALGMEEITGRRDGMIDTLERPTTIGVRASEQRLELLEGAGVLQAGLDAAQTARAENSIEKMLAHQVAAAHVAAMKLLAHLPSAKSGAQLKPGTQFVEIARLGNTAARLMEVSVSASLALQRLKTGGTQRVLVQHQQFVLANDASNMTVNPPLRNGRGRRRRGTDDEK